MYMDDLIAGVGSCVQRAQAAVEQAALEQYMGYFERSVPVQGVPDEEKPKEILIPRILDMTLPGDMRTVPVPLVALVNHNTLRLDKVKVRMNLIPTRLDNERVEVEAAPQGQEGHSLELVFQADGVNEAIARISSTASQMM